MKLTSQNLQAISQIYDVALDSNQSSSVLEDLGQQVGSIGCNVIVRDYTFTELTKINVSTKLMAAADHFVKNGYIKEMEVMLPNIQKIMPDQNFMSTPDI